MLTPKVKYIMGLLAGIVFAMVVYRMSKGQDTGKYTLAPGHI
jgi:hypothetical protein